MSTITTQQLYPLGVQAFAGAGINWTSDTIEVELVRTIAGPNAGGNSVYTPSTSDQYLSTIPSNTYCRPTQSQPQQITSPTDTNGTEGGSNVTFTSVPLGDPIQAIVIYKNTGSPSTSPLIAFINGQVVVTCATTAAAHATSIQVDPLPAALGSGTSFTFQTSGVTVTLNANASKGARSISVNDIGSTGINAGDSGPCYTSGVNLPITPNGGSITVNWDATYKIFTL